MVLNVNSCSNCNRYTSYLNANPTLSTRMKFLFSSEESTLLQAQTYVEELMSKHYTVVMDSALYERVARQIYYFKMPHLVIYEVSTKQIQRLIPIDSITYYADVIDLYATPETVRLNQIEIPRFQRMIGERTVRKIGNFIFVLQYQARDRLFCYNLITQKLDSIYFNDSLTKSLIHRMTRQKVNMSEINTFYKYYDFPYRLVEFGIDPSVIGDALYLSTDVLFVDPHGKKDTLSPIWGPFVMRFKPEKKSMEMFYFKWWQSDEDPEKAKSKQDLGYTFKDRNYLYFGGDSLTDDASEKIKLLLRFKMNEYQQQFEFDTVLKVYNLGKITDFDGQYLNKPYMNYRYELSGPYLFFHESPFIQDLNQSKSFNLLEIDSTIEWIYDIQVTEHLLTVLVKTDNQQIYTFNIDRQTFQLLNRRNICQRKSGYSNLMLDHQKVYFLNKKGDLVIAQ